MSRVLVMKYNANHEIHVATHDSTAHPDQSAAGRAIADAARYLEGCAGIDPASIRFEWLTERGEAMTPNGTNDRSGGW